MPRLHLGAWVDSGVDFLQQHLSWLFDAISALVTGLYDGIDAVLSAPAPLLFAGILAVGAWWLRGLLAGLLAFAGFALVDAVGLWEDAMSTLSLVLVATLVTLVFAIPLGIWASRSDRVSAVLRPVLDFMQTMPAMVYLIPGIIFFGVGVVPGIIATIIFSLPPGVRMTELGIRQVDAELVEAAEAFGTSPRDTLVRVQLPLALPTVMAGVNQVIMLGLSMVVIAGMVGGGGLGGAVYKAIGNVDIGLGFEAGISIVILAMYLDRMTGALGRQVSPIGRRTLAKARAAATGAAKVWNHRPQPAYAISGAVVLALVAGGLNTFGGSAREDGPAGAADIGKGRTLSVGYIPWDEGIASTFLWKELLERRGFKVDARQLEAGALYTGLAGGQLDFQTDAWLPVTHAQYWEKYGNKLEDLGSWYGPTSLELSVPSYVKDVRSLADLKGKSGQFKGRIIGIEPSSRRDGDPQGQGPQGVRAGRRVPGRRRLHPRHARRTQAGLRQEGTRGGRAVVAALGLLLVRTDQAGGPQGRLGRRRRDPHPGPQGLRRRRARGGRVAALVQAHRGAAHRPGGEDPGDGQGQGTAGGPRLAGQPPRGRPAAVTPNGCPGALRLP